MVVVVVVTVTVTGGGAPQGVDVTIAGKMAMVARAVTRTRENIDCRLLRV